MRAIEVSNDGSVIDWGLAEAEYVQPTPAPAPAPAPAPTPTAPVPTTTATATAVPAGATAPVGTYTIQAAPSLAGDNVVIHPIDTVVSGGGGDVFAAPAQGIMLPTLGADRIPGTGQPITYDVRYLGPPIQAASENVAFIDNSPLETGIPPSAAPATTTQQHILVTNAQQELPWLKYAIIGAVVYLLLKG